MIPSPYNSGKKSWEKQFHRLGARVAQGNQGHPASPTQGRKLRFEPGVATTFCDNLRLSAFAMRFQREFPPMKILRLATLLLGLASSAAALAQMPRMELTAGFHRIEAEVAATQADRMQGLMQRRNLGPNQGMLFIFPQAQRHCMWMKNTVLPLSVAFLDEEGRILNIRDMQPQTENNHCADAPARFALEMNQGWFAAKGIKPGMGIGGLQRAPAAR